MMMNVWPRTMAVGKKRSSEIQEIFLRTVLTDLVSDCIWQSPGYGVGQIRDCSKISDLDNIGWDGMPYLTLEKTRGKKRIRFESLRRRRIIPHIEFQALVIY